MQRSFAITGNTSLVVATSSTATPLQISTGNGYCTRVVNGSTIDAYLSFGISSTIQATFASTTSAGGFYIPGVAAHFECYLATPPNCFVSAVTSAGSANIFLTPGNNI